MEIDWQRIKGFYYVATTGSFTKAADATLRTQSALSQQVKALEEELGCPLLERMGRRRLRVTRAGERLLDFARIIFEESRRLEEDLGELRGAMKGRLKVAAPFTTLYHLFPEKLGNYMKNYPLVELTVLDRPQKEVVELVSRGEVDFGVVLEELVPGSLESVRWREVDTVLIAPEGHPLCKSPRVRMAEIAKYPLILPPKSHHGRKLLEGEFKKRGLGYTVVMESSNVELSSVYVEMGLGVSFGTVVRGLDLISGRGLAFIGLGRYFKPGHISIVMRKMELSPVRKAFLDALMAG